MFDLMTTPNSWPFTLAFGVEICLLVVLLASLIVGLAMDELLELALPDSIDTLLQVDADGHYFFEKYVTWLCFGRVPLVFSLVIFFGFFSSLGFVMNSFSKEFLGFYAWWPISGSIALVLASDLTSRVVRGLSRIMPEQNNSDAVSLDGAIGQIAYITVAQPEASLPATAKVSIGDETFRISVFPEDLNRTFNEYNQVIIITGRVGNNFYAKLPNE